MQQQQPIHDSFKRAHPSAHDESSSANLISSQSPVRSQSKQDPCDETFMTNDTSFVTNTPVSRLPTKFKDAAPGQGGPRPPSGLRGRGGAAVGTRGARGGVGSGADRGAAAARGPRGSGIARGKPRGMKR